MAGVIGYPRQPEPSSEPVTVTWDEETWRVWRDMRELYGPPDPLAGRAFLSVPLRQTGPDTWEGTYTMTFGDGGRIR